MDTSSTPVICTKAFTTIDLADLERKASVARYFMLSHMRGHIADMAQVMDICQRHNLLLIEDCAHRFTAFAFGRLLVQYRIPDLIAQGLLNFSTDVHVIWILVILFLLFIGMFMETLAIIMIVTPVLLPVMTQLGVDPIHFGTILVCCCGVGFSTPPLGENMFIASGIADITLEEISYKALPFCAITVGVIVLMAAFPQLVLWLPTVMGY